MPEGTYPAKVLSHGLVKSKDKGTPGLALRFQYDTPEGSKTISRVYWLTRNTLDFTLKMLKECFGWTGTNFRDLHNSGEPAGFRFVGDACEVVNEFEEYTDTNSGEIRRSLKVKYVNPAGGGGDGGHLELEDPEVAALSEKIKGSVVKYRQDHNEKIVNAPGESGSGDDDLPF